MLWKIYLFMKPVSEAGVVGCSVRSSLSSNVGVEDNFD
jgi:hypothetical protein